MSSPLSPWDPEASESPDCVFPTSSYHSARSSPSSSSSTQQRSSTLPILNPVVNDPSWPAATSGGVVSRGLLANADAACAVASPLMDPARVNLIVERSIEFEGNL